MDDNLFKNHKGKKVIIFTKAKFRYEGTLIEGNHLFIEMYDTVKKKKRLLNTEMIEDIEMVEE